MTEPAAAARHDIPMYVITINGVVKWRTPFWAIAQAGLAEHIERIPAAADRWTAYFVDGE